MRGGDKKNIQKATSDKQKLGEEGKTSIQKVREEILSTGLEENQSDKILATMFGGGYDYYYDQYSTGMGFRSFITTFIVSYFVIPLFSFIKEILTITLSMVHSLKEIEKNTQNFDESTRALL